MRSLHLGLAAALLSMLVTAPAAADQKAEAKERFEKGVALYNNADYGAALVEFRAAYAAMPHFAVRYNLGITLYKLHRYAEAMDELLAFLAEGQNDIEEARREEVEALVGELGSYVSLVTFTCNVAGAKLFLNGTFKTELTGLDTMALDVGEYDMEVGAKGHESHYQHIEIPGGQEISLEIDLAADVVKAPHEVTAPGPGPAKPPPPVAPKKPSSRPAFYGLLGITVASGVTSAVLGGLFLSKRSKYESLSWEDDWEKAKKDLRPFALGADVMYGVTGALAVATIVVAVLAFRKKPESKAVSLSPWLDCPGLTIARVF